MRRETTGLRGVGVVVVGAESLCAGNKKSTQDVGAQPQHITVMTGALIFNIAWPSSTWLLAVKHEDKSEWIQRNVLLCVGLGFFLFCFFLFCAFCANTLCWKGKCAGNDFSPLEHGKGRYEVCEKLLEPRNVLQQTNGSCSIDPKRCYCFHSPVILLCEFLFLYCIGLSHGLVERSECAKIKK